MVRGVNRTIIEINCTESRYFDKVLLFVDPGCELSASQLDKKAREYAKSFDDVSVDHLSVEKQNSKRNAILLVSGAILFLAIAIFLAFGI